MVSLARRLRERLFWPSERSMQKLMGDELTPWKMRIIVYVMLCRRKR